MRHVIAASTYTTDTFASGLLDIDIAAVINILTSSSVANAAVYCYATGTLPPAAASVMMLLMFLLLLLLIFLSAFAAIVAPGEIMLVSTITVIPASPYAATNTGNESYVPFGYHSSTFPTLCVPAAPNAVTAPTASADTSALTGSASLPCLIASSPCRHFHAAGKVFEGLSV